ncbi:hypothetical protein BH09PSE5_BH09PSE5_18720 [soil metagenome]
MQAFASPRSRAARSCRTLIASVAAAAALTACGGGVGVGLGIGYTDYGDYDAYPPSVAIASPQAAVVAGGTVRLVAAAADENGIYQVTFYRLDGDIAVPLVGIAAPPYQYDALVPADGRGSVSYFAEAIDGTGRRNSSTLLTFTLAL